MCKAALMEAPLSELLPTACHASHTILLTIGELDLTELKNNIFNTIAKVANCLHTQQPTDKQWKSLFPLFGWLNKEVIKKTFDCTTQNHYKALYLHQNKPITADTVYFNVSTTAWRKCCPIPCQWQHKCVCNIHGMKSEKQFVNTLKAITQVHSAKQACFWSCTSGDRQ